MTSPIPLRERLAAETRAIIAGQLRPYDATLATPLFDYDDAAARIYEALRGAGVLAGAPDEELDR